MDDKIHFVTLPRKPIYKNPCVNSELHRDFLCFWMAFLVNRLDFLIYHVGIKLGG